MKKLFALLVCVLLVFALASCGDDPCSHRDADGNSLCDKCGESYTDDKDLPDEHTHDYTIKNTNNQYLATIADCTNAATYYYSCSCGAKGTSTFDSGSAKGHNYTVKNTNSKYLATSAGCGNAATYYYSCSCGAKGSSTFTSGSATGHNWENDGLSRICTACHTTQGYDIQVPDAPMKFSNRYASAEITSITFTPQSWESGSFYMNVYVKKTYEKYSSESVYIDYKLYDSNNVVVISGMLVVYGRDAVGDTILKKIPITGLSLEESYRLVFE